MKVLLLQPPYSDYTCPYHALSYLLPLFEGHEVVAKDLSAAWFRWAFSRQTLHQWASEFETERAELEAQDQWSIADQRRVVELVQSVTLCRALEPDRAVRVLRGEGFWDYGRYLSARAQVRAFERVLGTRYPVFDFFHAFQVPPPEPQLDPLLRDSQRFDPLLGDLAALLPDGAFELVGITIPFNAQLRLGLSTAGAVRSRYPNARIVIGGTAATDMFKNVDDRARLQALAPIVDDLFLGEAEEQLDTYLGWLQGTASRPECVVPLSTAGEESICVPEATANPSVSPDHSWVDWDLYLSPERQVNYSPTRGCFWNRCTFCDYGLNTDRPTARFRGGDPSSIVDDLEDLAAAGITNVYFAADAIPVPLLVRVAQGLIDRGVELRWSAELFLTPQLNQAALRTLHRSGFVTASFGLESGSSRVLETMGKGRNRVERVLRPVFEAVRTVPGASLQPKYFFGFPGETDLDRAATLSLLFEFEEVFSVLPRAGVFDLTAGSIVAKEPERFGITRLWRDPEDDLGGGMRYETDEGPAPLASTFASWNRQIPAFEPFERPWVGGIDTLHTKLYVARFGRQITRELRRQWGPCPEAHRPWHVATVESRYDLEEAFENALADELARAACNRSVLEDTLGAEELQQSLDALAEPLRPARSVSQRLRFR